MNRLEDPFAYFMEFWVPTCGVQEAFHAWCEKLNQAHRNAFFVIPDIVPFLDTSGVYITGRRDWREHLKRLDAIELSHDDLQRQTEKQLAQRAAQRERIKKAQEQTKVTYGQAGEPVRASATAQRVAERLHGRPMPDRPTLIKIAMEERLRK